MAQTNDPDTEWLWHDGPTDSDLAEVRTIATASARYYGAKPHELDDIVQRTMIKVWEQWNAPHMTRARRRRGVRWAAYIRRITKHTHLDLIRSNRRRLQRDATAADIPHPLPPRPGVERDTGNGVDHIELSIARDYIIELLAQLPERQRLVATLVLVEEKTPTEVGERLDWEPQAVRKSLRIAKEKLKRLMQEQELNP